VRLALLLCALVLAGCTSGQPLGLSGKQAGPAEPYFKEYREVVAPHTERTKAFPVGAGAIRANVTMDLLQRGNGLPLPDAAAATVTFAVLDPAGAVVDAKTVDARAPNASLVLTELAKTGEWTVHITGAGASGAFEDASYGAEYLLSVEVLY
jgi:hypothetical protein